MACVHAGSEGHPADCMCMPPSACAAFSPCVLHPAKELVAALTAQREVAGGAGEEAREAIYNTDVMHDKLEDISWTEEQPWEETLAITSARPADIADVDDDLERELAFYNQVRGGSGRGAGGRAAGGWAPHSLGREPAPACCCPSAAPGASDGCALRPEQQQQR